MLDNISVCFQKGMIHGIIGKNGSGKTLFLKTISGYLKPNIGTISIEGKQLYRELSFPPSMGLIIEEPGFLYFENAIKNLEYLARIRDIISDKEIKNALRMVGLENETKKAIRQYSLGMRKRLGIAQAIMENPYLLILDEPFNSLDAKGVETIRSLLCTLREKGTTVILTSHHDDDIKLLCDTVHEIDNGKIIRIK